MLHERMSLGADCETCERDALRDGGEDGATFARNDSTSVTMHRRCWEQAPSPPAPGQRARARRLGLVAGDDRNSDRDQRDREHDADGTADEAGLRVARAARAHAETNTDEAEDDANGPEENREDDAQDSD